MVIRGTHVRGMSGAQRSFKRQKKLFRQLGLPKVETIYDGTINIDTSPQQFEILTFDYFFKDLIYKSFPRKRVEDFGFIKIEALVHSGLKYEKWGYIYFPHKSPHFEKLHIFELVGPEIPGLRKGDEIKIRIKEGRLRKRQI